MPKQRFVNLNDTVRLDLSDGDWVEVRRGLSYGQSLDLLAASYRPDASGDGSGSVGGPPALRFDAVRYPLAELAAWLRGWSFVDEQGDQVPVNEQTIRALDPATAAEVIELVRAHAQAVRADDPKAGAGAGSTSR